MKTAYLVCAILSGCGWSYADVDQVASAERLCSTNGGLKQIAVIGRWFADDGYLRAGCANGAEFSWIDIDKSAGRAPR